MRTKLFELGNTLDVLYEDNHLLVVNKPSGTLVQGDSTGDKPLVEVAKEYVKDKYHKPGAVFLGVVHRLDRPVSGVVVFARTSKALGRMNAQFRDKTTEKIYWAIVSQKPAKPSGRLVHWLEKDEKKNKTTAYTSEESGGKRSELTYEIVGARDNFYLLQVMPVTGRPHQIRVQLASMGCPIVGDLKYGHNTPNSDGSICLHARSLAFTHPVTKVVVRVEATPPSIAAWKVFR